MLRVALVGAGGMAGMHASCYTKIANAELVGIMDTRLEAATALAEKSHSTPYTDFDRMLDETRPDVVDVCCPTPWHVDYVCRAAERAGEWGLRGISTEKPMARTVEECRRMIAACELADVPLFVAHVLRFFPEYALAKQGVEGGYVGQPAAIRTRRGGPMPRAWNDWYANFDWSGGLILDLIIHDFDWLRWTFGKWSACTPKAACLPNCPDTTTRWSRCAFKAARLPMSREPGTIRAGSKSRWKSPGTRDWPNITSISRPERPSAQP